MFNRLKCKVVESSTKGVDSIVVKIVQDDAWQQASSIDSLHREVRVHSQQAIELFIGAAPFFLSDNEVILRARGLGRGILPGMRRETQSRPTNRRFTFQRFGHDSGKDQRLVFQRFFDLSHVDAPHSFCFVQARFDVCSFAHPLFSEDQNEIVPFVGCKSDRDHRIVWPPENGAFGWKVEGCFESFSNVLFFGALRAN